MRERSPLLRVASTLALLAVFAVSLFLGLAVFVMLLAMAALLALVLYLRFWWKRRRWRRSHAPQGATLEGEFTVEREGPRRRD